jgi:phosphoglycerate dehydrogenase-like enzyme
MIDKDTILIIDQFHPQVLLELEEHFEVNFKPEITRKQLLVEIKNADILIISTRIIIDSELIAAAKEVPTPYKAWLRGRSYRPLCL